MDLSRERRGESRASDEMGAWQGEARASEEMGVG